MHGAMRERSDVLECFCCLAAAVTLWGVLNLCGSYITDSAHVTDLKKAKGLSCVAGWSERARESVHTHTHMRANTHIHGANTAVSSCHVDLRAFSSAELCQCQKRETDPQM